MGEADPQTKKLPVLEIFGPTIQGEGHLAGVQTHFIRFGACDYKCKMCDSIHAIDPNFIHDNAMWMVQEEIFKTLQDKLPNHTPWVTLSGGNPAIHNLSYLTHLIRTQGYLCAIETQGTFAPHWISELSCITVSPKSPGMGEKFEEQKFRDFLHKFSYNVGLNVKVVVFSAQDLEFAAYVNEISQQYIHSSRFYLSLGNPQVPTIVDGELRVGTENKDEHRLKLLNEYAQLVEEITADKRLWNAKFFPQLHVLAFGNEPGR